MAYKKVVIAGATGLVGNAALRHFGGTGGCEIVALSRRKPRDLDYTGVMATSCVRQFYRHAFAQRRQAAHCRNAAFSASSKAWPALPILVFRRVTTPTRLVFRHFAATAVEPEPLIIDHQFVILPSGP